MQYTSGDSGGLGANINGFVSYLSENELLVVTLNFK
jgi:hypothetical protein